MLIKKKLAIACNYHIIKKLFDLDVLAETIVTMMDCYQGGRSTNSVSMMILED